MISQYSKLKFILEARAIYIEEESLGFIVYTADLRMKQYLNRKIKLFKITPEQWMILSRLYEEDGISQKELSEKTLKDQAALTRTLDRMEKKELIKRKVSPKDRRSFLVYLTDAGQTMRGQIGPIAVESVEKAAKGLTEEEVKTLKSLLKRAILNFN